MKFRKKNNNIVEMKIVAHGTPSVLTSCKVRLLRESNPVRGRIQPLEPDLPSEGGIASREWSEIRLG
jgi:hypothetical protein